MSSLRNHHRHKRSSGSRDRRLAARIMKEFAAAMPAIITQIQSLNSNGSATSAAPNNYDFRNFLSTKPPSFHGEENVTALLQWFEEMENIFIHYECPDDKRTKFASSCFGDQAVIWWNALRNDQGSDLVVAMPWEELKEAMKKEFCPEHELKRLEAEFWDLKQIGGDNSTYSSRFRKPSRIVSHLVTPRPAEFRTTFVVSRSLSVMP
ncbi:uncharacterized protein LOC143551883 [Bidens hawaiensis]|uniref:uncharacterized protein LOC143551883 n=1 Tax=Bidens hawaiensis TaxID=980011 RepID=UPI0040495388